MLYLLLSLAIFAMVQAQDCPGGLVTPQLCNSNDIVVDIATCSNHTVDFGAMEPCCRLQKEHAQKCDDPNAIESCRSMEIGPALCPGGSSSGCDEDCSQKNFKMDLFFEFQFSNTSCCSNCRCYGDPHCEDFKGNADTWVICDARNPRPGNLAQCPTSYDTCLAQLDHTGKPCNWIAPTVALPPTWVIALQGSPCRPATTTPPPLMNMYSFNGFKILLYMGERSIISDVLVTDGTNTYNLNAQACFDYALSNRTVTPWRDSTGNVPSQIDWLPKKWSWIASSEQDVDWQVSGFDSKIDMMIRCTRSPQMVNGRQRYGPPRLNVDLVEPYNYADIDNRVNTGGFCPTGKIAKQGSTANTDKILSIGACDPSQDNLATARALCGEATSTAGIAGCQLRWCQGNLQAGATLEQGAACVNDIQTFGWDAEFCAYNVFGRRQCISGDPSCLRNGQDCQADADCRTCRSAIRDDGWASAIARYTANLGPSDTDNCKIREELPADLLRPCGKGVRVQYQFNGEWITKFAIPSTTCVKDGVLHITKQTDPELFVNPMRLIQCSAKDGTCLTQKCDREVGFTARVEFTATPNPIAATYQLFQSGDLVCNPARWPTDTACLNFVPPATCPCPT